MAQITKEYLDSLSEDDIIFIRNYIWNRFGRSSRSHAKKKIEKGEDVDAEHHSDSFERPSCCPNCSSKHFIRYGHKDGIQRFFCKSCSKTFLPTTGNLMSSNRLSDENIRELIECEIEGLSLKETAYRSHLSKSTCFCFRQRLYRMADYKMSELLLNGQIQIDATYTRINLSGTKPKNMPRYSKKRGKKGPSVGELKSLRGISHHKVCIVTAEDENDNILYRVAGLGQETAEKYEQYAAHFDKPTLIISDNNSCIATFADTHKIQHDVIPSSKASKRFTTPKGNSVGDVNELHLELKHLIRVKHGVSTRHLSGYLAWISYLKKTSYTIERSRMVEYIFNDLFAAKGTYLIKDICKSDQPISLYEAYFEYHYGIFESEA